MLLEFFVGIADLMHIPIPIWAQVDGKIVISFLACCLRFYENRHRWHRPIEDSIHP